MNMFWNEPGKVLQAWSLLLVTVTPSGHLKNHKNLAQNNCSELKGYIKYWGLHNKCVLLKVVPFSSVMYTDSKNKQL